MWRSRGITWRHRTSRARCAVAFRPRRASWAGRRRRVPDDDGLHRLVVEALAVAVPQDLEEAEKADRRGCGVAAEALEREPPVDRARVQPNHANAGDAFAWGLSAHEGKKTREVDREPAEAESEIVGGGGDDGP